MTVLEPTQHIGVYGVWIQDGKLVTIRKARGPYTGLLDLPGGSPEPGESPEQTLQRELVEECGVSYDAILEWKPFSLRVTESSSGERIDFLHSGLLARVDVQKKVQPVVDVEDVAGVELMDVERRCSSECSRLLREALTQFPGMFG